MPTRQRMPVALRTPDANRRTQERTGFTTVALVVPSAGPLDGQSIQRCWTRDISATGACLLSDSPLPDEFVVQLLLPEFEDRLIRAIVVSCRTESVISLSGTRQRNVYGVRFAGFLR